MEIISSAMIRLSKQNISGVILAGGESTRLGGRNKANFLIGGEKIITKTINLLRSIFDELIIVTNAPHEFEQLTGLIITSDYFKKRGPLGGIHSAMKSSSKEAVFIFAGDMPFLNKRLIFRQIEYFKSLNCDALIPLVNKLREPLHGIYRNLLSDRLEEYLRTQTDFAVREFLDTTDAAYFNPGRSKEVIRAFTNINTAGQLNELT